MSARSLACLARVATLSLFVLGSARAQDNSVIISGDVRFTVITPNLVRIEQSPGGRFVDDPSLFAVKRERRFNDAIVRRDGEAVDLQTSAFHLRYKPDGKPLSAANLTIEVVGGANPTWTPGAKNQHNLGGTARTLDTWDGARELSDGLLARDGWYCIDDSHSPLFTSDWVRARAKDAGTDWYFFAYGNDYRAALKSLTAIGGEVAMPRRYTLGAWYSRYWPHTADDFKTIVNDYAAHDFPLDVVVLDMDWHREGWTGYSWNRSLLPDAEGLLKWFHDQGLHVTLNDHPADGVKPDEDRYADFMRALGKDPASNETVPYDAGDKTYLTAHYDHMMAPLVRDGVDFWWLDWQQYPNTRSIPELTNLFWLNHYYFARTADHDQRGQVFSRWAGWGSHRYPIQFSGDASTNWRMLAFEVPFTATAGNVGCFYWSHDIGGHQGPRNEESYARWIQFGAMSATLRSHSTRDANLDRRPWTYPKWVEGSARTSFHLRSRLMPYLYSSVKQVNVDSVPLTRPMYFDYPTQERAYHSPQQYLLGDHLLVAPITSPGVGPNRIATQVVWFPPGDTWFNFFSGESFVGGRERLVAADINEFPLYVRGGVPIAMQTYTQRMTTTPLSTLVVRAYPGEVGRTGTYTLYEDDGLTRAHERGAAATTRLSYSRTNETVTIEIGAAEGSFEGQSAERCLVLELPCTGRATHLTVDGQATAALEYDADTFTNRITLPASSVRRAHVISVQTRNAGEPELRERALVRRAGSADLDAALAGPESAQIALAARGIGLFEKNDTPYGFPAMGTLGLYAPAGSVDGNQIRFTVGEATTTLPLAPGDGGFTPLSMATQAIAPPSPTRNLAAAIELQVKGKAIRLNVPDMPVDFKHVRGNVAPLAQSTASSATAESPASGATDGRVGGYPQQRNEEWTTVGQAKDATLKLTWKEPQRIDRVWLFDRQNNVDQTLAGELQFDDESRVPFGELPNDASSGADIAFADRSTRTLTIRLTQSKASTENLGLAEVVVLKADR